MDLTRQAKKASRQKQTERARWGKVSLSVALSILGLAVIWLGLSSVVVLSSLSDAKQSAELLQESLGNGDEEQVHKASKDFTSSSSLAHALSRDFVWRVASAIPWIGPNFSAVSKIAASAETIARDGVPSALALRDLITPSALKPRGGGIDVKPFIAAQSDAARSAQAFNSADKDLTGIETSQLLEPLRGQAIQAQEIVHQLTIGTSVLNAIVQIGPGFLGFDQPRKYAVMFQNVAEARASGGIPGAMVLLETNQGVITMTKEVSSADFPIFDPPVMQLPTTTRTLFGDQPAQQIQDVNYTPDFELTGQLVQKMWEQRFSERVDGVISVDPVALSYLLKATGPITLVDGELLTSENALQLLLRDVYATYPIAQDQDEYFSEVAKSVFEKIVLGEFDTSKFITAVNKAGQEHRIFMWNSNPLEQQFISGTSLSTLLPQSTSANPEFGIYFNDQTGSKMDVFLDVSITSSVHHCRFDERPVYAINISLTNTAPLDAAESLPKYVTGGGEFGTSPGVIRTQVLGYAPSRGDWQPIKKDGLRANSFVTTDVEYTVNVIEIYLVPGESSVVTFEFVGEKQSDNRFSLITTPLPSLKNIDPTFETCGNAVQ